MMDRLGIQTQGNNHNQTHAYSNHEQQQQQQQQSIEDEEQLDQRDGDLLEYAYPDPTYWTPHGPISYGIGGLDHDEVDGDGDDDIGGGVDQLKTEAEAIKPTQDGHDTQHQTENIYLQPPIGQLSKSDSRSHSYSHPSAPLSGLKASGSGGVNPVGGSFNLNDRSPAVRRVEVRHEKKRISLPFIISVFLLVLLFGVYSYYLYRFSSELSSWDNFDCDSSTSSESFLRSGETSHNSSEIEFISSTGMANNMNIEERSDTAKLYLLANCVIQGVSLLGTVVYVLNLSSSNSIITLLGAILDSITLGIFAWGVWLYLSASICSFYFFRLTLIYCMIQIFLLILFVNIWGVRIRQDRRLKPASPTTATVFIQQRSANSQRQERYQPFQPNDTNMNGQGNGFLGGQCLVDDMVHPPHSNPFNPPSIHSRSNRPSQSQPGLILPIQSHHPLSEPYGTDRRPKRSISHKIEDHTHMGLGSGTHSNDHSSNNKDGSLPPSVPLITRHGPHLTTPNQVFATGETYLDSADSSHAEGDTMQFGDDPFMIQPLPTSVDGFMNPSHRPILQSHSHSHSHLSTPPLIIPPSPIPSPLPLSPQRTSSEILNSTQLPIDPSELSQSNPIDHTAPNEPN